MIYKAKWSLVVLAVILVVLVFSTFSLFAQDSSMEKPYVFDEDGNLIRPEGYREWLYIGTPITPNDLNPPEAAFPEFHNVYIHPNNVAYYKANGSFPDGTILVKELVSVGSTQAVSGNGYFQGDFIGLEAAVKDVEHFPNEPSNWAYFSFGHSYPLTDTATAFPTESCNACHQAVAAEDFIFTQYYPVLNAIVEEAKSAIVEETQNEAKSEEAPFSPYVNGEGEISLPKDFRKTMSHLGSWFVPEGDASGFHDVYADQTSVEQYRETGEFPDGAILVKELRASEAGDYTTGNGVSYPTESIKQWFVMVKDSKDRFTDNKNWGEGWGWALFKPDNMNENVSTDYKADCLGCHIPAKDTDWIYVEVYPTLSE